MTSIKSREIPMIYLKGTALWSLLIHTQWLSRCFVTLAFEQSFPLRDVSKHNYVKREPWFTIGLLVSSKQKFSKKVRHQYKQYNNMFNQTKRRTKRHIGKLQKAFICILRQAIVKTNGKLSYPHTFIINNITMSAKFDISQGFNKQIFDIGINMIQTNISRHICPSQKRIVCSLHRWSHMTLFRR